MSHLLPGHYKTRLRKVWFPVLVRVENSTDDDGRVADRPRLVLYLGGERHERPDPEKWSSRLWPCDDAEYRRLTQVHTAETASETFSLATASPMF